MTYKPSTIRKAYRLLQEVFDEFDKKRFDILVKLMGYDDASVYADHIQCPNDFLKYMKKVSSNNDYFKYEQIWQEEEKVLKGIKNEKVS